MKNEFSEVQVENNLMKIWKCSAQSQNKSWREFFSREVFFQTFLLDTYTANSRRLLKRLSPMCGNLLPKVPLEMTKKSFVSLNFVLQQKSGLVEWCFRQSWQKFSFFFWFFSKSTKHWMIMYKQDFDPGIMQLRENC